MKRLVRYVALAGTTLFGILFLFVALDVVSHYNYKHHRFSPFLRDETEEAVWITVGFVISVATYLYSVRTMRSK